MSWLDHSYSLVDFGMNRIFEKEMVKMSIIILVLWEGENVCISERKKKQ